MDDFQKVVKLLGEMNQRQKEMHSDITEMKQELVHAKQEREIIRETVVESVEGLQEVKNTLHEIKDDQKSIHEIIGEHEVSIRTMRRRPV